MVSYMNCCHSSYYCPDNHRSLFHWVKFCPPHPVDLYYSCFQSQGTSQFQNPSAASCGFQDAIAELVNTSDLRRIQQLTILKQVIGMDFSHPVLQGKGFWRIYKHHTNFVDSSAGAGKARHGIISIIYKASRSHWWKRQNKGLENTLAPLKEQSGSPLMEAPKVIFRSK